jgi:hypothetical protein
MLPVGREVAFLIGLFLAAPVLTRAYLCMMGAMMSLNINGANQASNTRIISRRLLTSRADRAPPRLFSSRFNYKLFEMYADS